LTDPLNNEIEVIRSCVSGSRIWPLSQAISLHFGARCLRSSLSLIEDFDASYISILSRSLYANVEFMAGQERDVFFWDGGGMLCDDVEAMPASAQQKGWDERVSIEASSSDTK
jgi:hypothetical protein